MKKLVLAVLVLTLAYFSFHSFVFNGVKNDLRTRIDQDFYKNTGVMPKSTLVLVQVGSNVYEGTYQAFNYSESVRLVYDGNMSGAYQYSESNYSSN
jgi:hypothetical protein